MTRPLLQRIAFFARRRYRWIFAAFAVALVLSAFLVSRLSLDTDLMNLLPRGDETVETFRDTMERFGTIDYLLVVVRIPEAAVLAPYESFADDLATRIEGLPQVGEVEYRLGETEELLQEFYPKAALFLDEEGRRQVEERLSDEEIRLRVAEMRRLLSTPQGSAARRLLALDPFGLADVFLGRLGESRGALAVDWASGYYVSRDHRLLLLLAKPVRPPQDIDFDEQLVGAVEAEVAAAREGWPAILGFGSMEEAREEGFPEPPEVVLGGSYLTALDDARFIVGDAVLGFATAMAGVLLLFLFAFRRLGPLLFAALPLVCGLLLTFGFAAIAVGSLSTATSGTAALLIGLGLDFVIVSYGRYVEERRAGASVEEALVAMSGSSGRAVVVGAITTAATFYAFLVTRFSGLKQMGILTGTGILLCMLSVLFLLPALIAWREDRHKRNETGPRLYLHSFGTRHLMGASMDRPRTVLALGAVLTVAALALAFQLEFQESTATMRPAGNRGIEVSQEVGERFGSGFDYMMLVVDGATEEQAVARAGRAVEAAERLVEEGVLNGFSGITSLIPPPNRQAAVLDWLDRGRENGLAFERIEGTFRGALAEQGLRAEPFAEGLALLRTALDPAGAITADDLAGNPQTAKLLERYLQPREPDGATGDGDVEAGDAVEANASGWTSIVYLYPPDNLWRREAPPQVLQMARDLGSDVRVTGTNLLNQRVRQVVRTDAWAAGILGLVVVALLLYLDFRSLRRTVLSLVPLGVGISWMLGAMALLGMELNFMNIFVTTMIIGIGVDYGLHVVHRYRECTGRGPEALRQGLVETGNAIVVAALSTVAGFGSLVFSHYPGLRSVGLVAILGAVFTALVAVTLLPAFLAWRQAGKEARRNAPGG